jgi:16S rRNA (cytidine1402-2'-O)-methyltransferase
MGAPTLFLVSTPIGNLEDVTLRALRVLREVALVAAEDTRHTAKLLSHYDIRTPTTSFYEQVEQKKTPRLLERLSAGDSIALVSDAGTPGISDPGYRLAKAAIAGGFRVEAVPGASSLLAALVPSGLPTSAFSFMGFPPPREQARAKWLAALAGRHETLVLFEAPHRVRDTLEAIRSVLGNRQIVVARELTKVHEEFLRGTVDEVLERLTTPRGEFTIVLSGAEDVGQTPETVPAPDSLLAEFWLLTESGASRREVINALAARFGVGSKEIYRAIETAKDSVK